MHVRASCGQSRIGVSFLLLIPIALALSPAHAGPFVRGDADGDGRLNITDPVRVLRFLFLGEAAGLPCLDSADADDNGSLSIADGIYVLSYLFRSGAAPAAPFPRCGIDPTPDALECARSNCCVQECQRAGIEPITATCDFDGDGFVDELVAVPEANTVTYLRGSPDGPMRVAEIAVGDSPIAIAVCDFDADGFCDAAVANFGSDSVTFLRGSSIGPTRVREEPVGDGPRFLVAGDVDGDGFCDLLVVRCDSGNVELLRGGPAGLVRAGNVADCE
jgi:hypothetical protein